MRAAALVVLGVALAGGCRRMSLARPFDGGAAGAPPAVASDQAPRAGDAGASGLPEDPEAGRKSEAQWRKHMEWEERERQLSFDKNRIPQHRAVIQKLAAARARYDGAKTKAAVERVRAEMPALRQDLQARATEIDHWHVNSPLLADYDAEMADLERAYPDAKLAALAGDAKPLRELRARLDQRKKRMTEWLADAKESEGE
jgi:hypothetical protein